MDFGTPVSNTVKLLYAPGELQSWEDVVGDFAIYGEIARVDATLAPLLNALLVTYFDVRHAAAVLVNFPLGRAISEPPSSQDYRAVRLTLTAALQKGGGPAGFACYGEVADFTILPGMAIVEFFDMRSAQALVLDAPDDASPWPAADGAELGSMAFGIPELAVDQGFQDRAHLNTAPGGLRPAAVPSRKQLNVHGGHKMSPVPALPPGLCSNAPQLPTAAVAGRAHATATPTVTENSQSAPQRAAPLRTKIRSKDFSKYDIDLEKIRRGEDRRTTVMVRNLSGPTMRQDLLNFLQRCGLQDRHTFFYTPCKEHRNVLAGVAFINLVAPGDVAKLFVMLKSGLWKEVRGSSDGDSPTTSPALSYARFQGHEELVEHFSTTAVMHEPDPQKRPIFSAPSPTATFAPAPMPWEMEQQHQMPPHHQQQLAAALRQFAGAPPVPPKVEKVPKMEVQMQPAYISVPGMAFQEPGDAPWLHESLAGGRPELGSSVLGA